jgi:hypothetical protein
MGFYKYLSFFLIGGILLISCSEKEKTITAKSNQPIQSNEFHRSENLRPGQSGLIKNNYQPGELLIKFAEGTEERIIENIMKQYNLEIINITTKLNIYHVKIKDDCSVEEIIRRLEDLEEIEYSEPNYVVTFQE